MMVIARGAGWSESFIRDELPLWRGWAYYHAARVLEGERFRWPEGGGTVRRWIGRVREWCRRK